MVGLSHGKSIYKWMMTGGTPISGSVPSWEIFETDRFNIIVLVPGNTNLMFSHGQTQIISGTGHVG